MKLATVIVAQAVGTTMPAPTIPPPEVLLRVIFYALILLFSPVSITMSAVQTAVIQSMITTANPFAVIHYLKPEKFAMEIVRPAATTKIRVPSMPCSDRHPHATQTVLIP